MAVAVVCGMSPLFSLALSAQGGSARSAIPDSVPSCQQVVEPAPPSWREVQFLRVTLRLPPGFVLSDRIVGIEHGGIEWISKPMTVRVINGSFDYTSFRDHSGARCVAEARGRRVLLIETTWKEGFDVTAWSPGIGPVLSAGSSRADDIPMMRRILLTVDSR
jgi:hypothetical protein